MGAQPPFRDRTVGALLSDLARAIPDREALVYADRGLRLTFGQLEDEARLIGRGLIACGVEPGERVALWATNIPEWIVLQFALAKIGAILVTVNTALRGSEVEYLLTQSEAGTVVSIRGYRNLDYVQTLHDIGAFSSRLPHLRRVVYIGDDCPADAVAYASLRELAAEIPVADLERRQAAVELDAVINMQYTSGTTGFPKGVMLSSRNIVNNGFWLGQGLGFTPEDRLCLCVPLFHCFGCVIGVLGAYTNGTCLCPVEVFDPLKVLETVESERCTALYGVPTMFLAELEHPEFSRFDLTSLRTGIMAGALCPETLIRRVMTDMHVPEITIAYGLTETSPGVSIVPRHDTVEHRTQTVGKILEEVEVKVVDPASGAEVSAGMPGELRVRGYNVMLGYYNNPAATRAALTDDGWLCSGDQAVLGPDGYLRITGRIKDIIIRGGENIAPKEVEDLLRLHPAVSDAYVYGIHDDWFGEDVAAAIRLKPGAEATEDGIQEFCCQRLASFKVPRHIRFVCDFPMTASGKIQKFKLREAHEQLRAVERQA